MQEAGAVFVPDSSYFCIVLVLASYSSSSYRKKGSCKYEQLEICGQHKKGFDQKEANSDDECNIYIKLAGAAAIWVNMFATLV